jgi:hypothetical protein
MARMKMTDHSKSGCTLQYTDVETDLQFVRTFTAPAAGGYVREIFDPMKDGQQVCEKLSSSGVTLMWRPSMGYLSDLIRREYKKARAADLRRMAA